jgi:hypothetical protein
MRKKGMEKAAKDMDTIEFFTEDAQKKPRNSEKTAKSGKYDITLATHIAYDDMVKFNNIIAAKSRNQIKILKQAEVLRNLILEYIKANEHLV